MRADDVSYVAAAVRSRLALQGLVHAIRNEPGFSPLTCSGALFSALGVAENELETLPDSPGGSR